MKTLTRWKKIGKKIVDLRTKIRGQNNAMRSMVMKHHRLEETVEEFEKMINLQTTTRPRKN